ncbi:MAG: GrpB family protein [Patescibacteria group bacterium UBA2163]
MKNKNLGLQRGTVQLSEYHPDWVDAFCLEKEHIEKLLGDAVLGVEHIGSTAIPGIKAKPILDFMVGIRSFDEWEHYTELLAQLGYEFRRDLREEQLHILFVKGPEENRTHYLKLAEIHSDFWTQQIIFRDFLIENPEYKRRYQALKERLLIEYQGERGPYSEGKKIFIKEALKRAGYQGAIL